MTSAGGDADSRLGSEKPNCYDGTGEVVGRTRRSLVGEGTRGETDAREMPAGSRNWMEAMLTESPW